MVDDGRRIRAVSEDLYESESDHVRVHGIVAVERIGSVQARAAVGCVGAVATLVEIQIGQGEVDLGRLCRRDLAERDQCPAERHTIEPSGTEKPAARAGGRKRPPIPARPSARTAAMRGTDMRIRQELLWMKGRGV